MIEGAFRVAFEELFIRLADFSLCLHRRDACATGLVATRD